MTLVSDNFACQWICTEIYDCVNVFFYVNQMAKFCKTLQIWHIFLWPWHEVTSGMQSAHRLPVIGRIENCDVFSGRLAIVDKTIVSWPCCNYGNTHVMKITANNLGSHNRNVNECRSFFSYKANDSCLTSLVWETFIIRIHIW